MNAPRSKIFDDVYFSAQDGLAETRHVFLEGNNLPAAWAGCEHFVIAETGFGTGLNFLAAWELFERTAAPDQRLEFISFEMYPLSSGEIRQALLPWENIFESQLEKFLSCYTLPPTGGGLGWRGELAPNINLRVILGDVNETIKELNTSVDCWFLDGFKPASNPQMWTQTVFKNMARCSRKGTSFATFTAAGAVRRGLQQVGFEVHKKPGFGRKREMLTGIKQ